ncbi:MAG: Uma2 family endonuclease [Acetobacteraceae bacterium]|nr:Uma2 family endonuclease [Acetobacteraceae bacterium]
MGKQDALSGTASGLRMGREEFREWAMEKGIRAERVAGEVVLMAPERMRHNRVKLNVALALREAIGAAGLPCEAFTDGVTIEVGEDTDYEPDAVVSCGDRLDDEAIAVADPVIVVEVESPSTRSVDAGGKLADYFRLASVQHYLIVRTRRRQVIHHRRDGERIETRIVNGGILELDPPGIPVAIETFYSG